MFKVLTSDLRPPLQGGDPLWSAGVMLPLDLPEVKLDRSSNECGAGWNFTKDIATGLRIAGMWLDGWPSRVFEVRPIGEAIERSDKLRAARLTIVRELSDEEIEAAIPAIANFHEHQERMVAEQIAWRRALARPKRLSPEEIEAHLRSALEARGLSWKIKRYENSRAAWAARAARAALDARAAWAARAARAALDARAAWAAWAALDARDAWAARAAWAAWDAWDAWAAQTSLLWTYAALKGWVKGSPDKHSIGIRDAYEGGLAIALPTGADELGWAMVES